MYYFTILPSTTNAIWQLIGKLASATDDPSALVDTDSDADVADVC